MLPSLPSLGSANPGYAVRGLVVGVSLTLVAAFGPAAAQSAPPAGDTRTISAAAAPAIAPAPRGRRDADSVQRAEPSTTFTTTDGVVPVVTGPNDDIEIGLDTRLYVPLSASRRKPAPAILMSHGFGGSKDSTEVLTTAAFFASHGYVVLTFSASGFGRSGGCVTLHSSDFDVKSSQQLLDQVLEPRKDVLHDRRGVVVGTIGGSYGGGFQLPLAAADKRVKASIVGRSWNNLAFSLNPNNRIVPGDRTGLEHNRNLQGVFKSEWTTLFYALGNAQPAMGNGGCPEVKAASQNAVEIAAAPNCSGFYLDLCAIYLQLASTGTTTAQGREFMAKASASNVIPKLKKPVLLVQSQSDTLFNLNDATATYTALKRQGTPVGMIWNSGGHGGYSSQPGECEAYDGIDRSVNAMSNCYLPLRSLGWMDHWLRGTEQGRGPEFTYYRDWVKYGGRGPNDEQYAKARAFPLPQNTRFTLTGTRTMRPRTGRVRPESVTFSNPEGGLPAAYSESSQFSGPDASPNLAREPMEVEGQHVSFTSTRLRRRLESAGIPVARLDITNSNGEDLVFFAKVYDVDRAGRAELVHRLISPVRVPAAEVGEPVTFAFTGFAHRFARGHRVRIVLSATDTTSYNAKAADTITVRTGRQSVFVLPGTMAKSRNRR